MGIASGLLNLGVRIEETVTAVGTRFGKVPLQWPAEDGGGVIYRLPRDLHQRASTFAETQPMVVNEGEMAVVLEDGKSHGFLGPGRYVFERARVTGVLDIVWVKSGQRQLKWGVGNITTTDGIQVSANGFAYVRIEDAAAFNSEVVQGAMTFGDMEFQKFLMPRVQSVLRATFAKWEALALQSERDAFSDAVKSALADACKQIGVTVAGFEVVDINFPPEFKEVISRATMVKHSGAAAVAQAQTAAQVIQIEAAATAQGQLAQGLAQLQLMEMMKEKGIDPLKLKALEALQTFAANPGQAPLVGDGGRAQLFGQVAGAALAGGLASAPPPAEAPKQIADATPATALPRDSEADLERQLDALTDRLAEGAISEETYKKLAERIETKLRKLREP
jgi:regulator of protease activity HflC (stomatin/prohibitin superfamily)